MPYETLNCEDSNNCDEYRRYPCIDDEEDMKEPSNRSGYFDDVKIHIPAIYQPYAIIIQIVIFNNQILNRFANDLIRIFVFRIY